MLSGNKDDTQIVSTIAFDADGSLYSVIKYMRLCIAILDKYWDFVRQYGNANPRSSNDEAVIKKTVDSILREIAAIDLTNRVGVFHIANPAFRQEVEKNIKQLSILFKQRASKIEAIRMVLATYIPLLNRLDARILKSIFIQANKELFLFLAEVLQRDRVQDMRWHLLLTGSRFY